MDKGLEDIKGVGAVVKTSLIEHFGSEEATLQALKEGEYDRLIEAGVPFSKAAEIARSFFSNSMGFTYHRLTKTPEGKTLFNQIYEVITKEAATLYGRIGVLLFYPTLDMGELKRRSLYARECMELSRDVAGKRKELKRLLKLVSRPREPKPKITDMIALEDRELYDELLKRLGGGNLILIESHEDLGFIEDFEFVRYVMNKANFGDAVLGLPNVEPIYDEDIGLIVPETVLTFYWANKESIRAALEITRLTGLSELREAGASLLELMDEIGGIGEKGLQGMGNQEVEGLRNAYDRLGEKAEEALGLANEAIAAEIEKMSLEGQDILNILQRGTTTTLLESLPRDFSDKIYRIAGEREAQIAEELDISPGILQGLFISSSYPLELDFNMIESAKQELQLSLKQHELRKMQELSKKLSPLMEDVKQLIERALELDLRLAIGFFSLDNTLVEPVFQEKLGLALKGGRNIMIHGGAEPIDYVIGETSLYPDHRERAVVITGANSGGKTTLIELLAETVILAHMGLGVPAAMANLSIFDELYYFGKGQGAGAGAFETLLETFEALTKPTDKRRLILADEIEAITEPGAAAIVISGILDWFKKGENTLIAIVTHLGEDIEKHVGQGIRIDGIEAQGLDKELNLIVERNPTLGKVAKSTPELIVERLSKKSNAKDFYKSILDRFKIKKP